MASRAEAARRRRRAAARISMRTNIEVCGAGARRSATCFGVRRVPGAVLILSLTFQRKDRIELHGSADGGGAAGESHEDGDGHDDGEEHGFDGNLRVEDGAADLM